MTKTPSNRERVDRCQQAITAYSTTTTITPISSIFSPMRCIGPTPMAMTFISLLPRLAATTSTNSTTNNKTKGD